MGGAVEPELDANLTLKRGSKRVQVPFPQSATKNVALPDARKWKTGGPHLYIINGGPEDAAIKDADGGAIATIDSGETAIIVLIDNSTAAGSWWYRIAERKGYAGRLQQDYDTLTGLTGPFVDQAINEDASVSGGILTVEGEDNGRGWVYCGRTGGVWLPALGSWELEAYITELNTEPGCSGGVGASYRDFLIGIDFFASLQVYVGIWKTIGDLRAIYSGVSDFYSGDLGVMPSVGTPITVKLTHEIVGVAHRVTGYYRIGASGAFTQFKQQDIPIASWSPQWDYKLDAGPVLRAATASANRHVNFDKIIYRITGLNNG